MAKMRTTSGKIVSVLMRDLDGRKVRTRRSMKNAHIRIPAGATCTVRGSWRSGVLLEMEPCKHCGVSVFINHVHRDEVLLVDDEG